MKQSIQFWFASGIALCYLAVSSPLQAQIVPDATLPSNSQVRSQGNISIITGGSRAGGNLFHSFSQFSVPTLGVAYFNNALNIQNIISRVTGSISNIDGLIRANGSANLFLLNPNGIIFGPNAQLRIGGSFVASTASSLKLADGTEFNAKTSETKPLLTVSVPIGLQYESSPGSIINQSQVADSSGTLIGLQVQPGKTLALVGGDVSLDGGGLTASGGRVELGGLTTAGTVGLSGDGSLSYPAAVQRADVAITNSARVSVAAAGGGSIAVNARNLDIAGGSSLLAGIGKGVGAVGSKAGDVTLNATDAITLAQASTVQNRVNSNAIGDSGNINVQAGALSVTDGSYLSSSTFGKGNAGGLFVQANGPVSLASGYIFNNVGAGAVGNAGGIFITAGSLYLTNGAQLQSTIREASKPLPSGRGNGGNVNINTRDAVTIAGADSDGNASEIFTNVESGAVGNGGNITLKAGALSLVDGAQLIAFTSGQGNAGSVFVQANGPVSLANGAILTNVKSGAVGNAGNITLNAGALSVTDRAEISAGTSGQGNAGSVFIQANGPVSLSNSSIFSNVQSGAVSSGSDITINAVSLSLDNGSQLTTSTTGQGNAGNIQVNATDSVFVKGSSALSAYTDKQGNAGSVTIAGRDGVVPVVLFDGVGAKGFPSSAVSYVGENSTGKGGDVNITARALYLTNGARLITSTAGQNLGQDAGNIRVNASESISASGGSTIESNTYGQGNAGNVTIQAGDVAFDGVGSQGFSTGVTTTTFGNSLPGFIGDRKGGDINITARSLSLTNGAALNAIVNGWGNGGSVNINVSNAVTFDGVGSNKSPSGAAISLNSGIGKGGDINITTGSLSLTNGAVLLAYTFGQGDAGNVRINARDAVTFDGVGSNGDGSRAFTSVGSGAVGKGGDINISTGSLSLTNGARLSSSTSGQGDAGNIRINARDVVTFDRVDSNGASSGAFSTVNSGAVGKSGDINISTGSLSLTNGAELSSSTSGQGNAGNVRINTRDAVTFDGVGSNRFRSGAFTLVDFGAVGKGGDINISTSTLSLTNGAGMSSSTLGQGDAGNVSINARDAFTATGANSAVASIVSREARGKGGDINITTGSLSLTNGAELLADTSGQGDAGNIRINARDVVTFDGLDSNGYSSGAFSTANSGAVGKGGDINIDPTRLTITNGAGVVVDSQGSGRGGNLNVQAGYLTLDDASLLARANSAEGGNIALDVPSLLLMRHNSRISATAGITGGSGNGGNIGINTKFLAAFPAENSDITANAFTGKGGNIQIAAQGIFGIASQFRNTPQSDITASSTLGINGTVQINTLVIDPSRGLVVLPAQLVDASGLIAQSCPATGGQAPSKFVVTGHGGLPPTPSHTLTTDAVLTNWASLEHENDNRSVETHVNNPAPETEPTQIIEAQGWVIGAHGKVILTAQPTNVTPNSPGLKPAACHGV